MLLHASRRRTPARSGTGLYPTLAAAALRSSSPSHRAAGGATALTTAGLGVRIEEGLAEGVENRLPPITLHKLQLLRAVKQRLLAVAYGHRWQLRLGAIHGLVVICLLLQLYIEVVGRAHLGFRVSVHPYRHHLIVCIGDVLATGARDVFTKLHGPLRHLSLKHLQRCRCHSQQTRTHRHVASSVGSGRILGLALASAHGCGGGGQR